MSTESENSVTENAEPTPGGLSEMEAAGRLDDILTETLDEKTETVQEDEVKEDDQEVTAEAEDSTTDEVETESEATEEDAEIADSEARADEAEGTEAEDDEGERVEYDIPSDYEFDVDGERKTLEQLKADSKQVKEFQRDYSRKTEEVKVQREMVETKASQVLEKVNELRQQGETLVATFEAFVGAEPQWNPADDPAEHPVEYMQFQENTRQYQGKIQQYWQLHNQIEQQKAEAETAAKQASEDGRAEQWEQVLVKMPHLRDETAFNSLRSEVVDLFTEEYGFDAEGIDAVLKTEVMPVIVDALAQIKLRREKPKAKAKIKKSPAIGQVR